MPFAIVARNAIGCGLLIPAIAVAADALVRIEKIGTETESIPMIAGQPQPIATGSFGRRG